MAQKTVSKKRVVTKLTASTLPAKEQATAVKKSFQMPSWRQIGAWLAWPFVTVYRRLRSNRNTSPHKSFIRTRRRDKIKKPKLEGYIAFPWYVAGVLWAKKWVYTRFIFTYVLLSATTYGAMQITNISSVNTNIDSAAQTLGSVFDPAVRAVITVGSAIGGAFNANLSDIQYLVVTTLYIFTALAIVWLLRQQLAGNAVKVRDGLYSAGAPILALFVLVAIAVAQLIPLALTTLVYVTANSSGILDGGIESAMFGVALLLVIVLTLYFMTTTLFSMFIATIPGTYPIKAYRTARQIVAGQRLRLLLRLLWAVLIILLFWFVILVPVVIITNSMGGQNTIVIPLAVQFMAGFSVIYGTAYAYLLYRRMIDDPVDEN
jgi:hypothetical protein